MIRGKQFLVGLLALAIALIFVPAGKVFAAEAAVTDEVQAFDNEEKQYTCNTTFNIIVEAISYTDTTFSVQGDATSGETVPKMYQTDLQAFTYTGSEKAYFDLELDIQDILDQLDLHTGGGSYVLGTPRAVSPDDSSYYGKINNSGSDYAKITDVAGVSLKGSNLSMTNVRGLDKHNWYGLRSDSVYNGGYTSLDAVRQVVIQIPYCVTEQVIDPEFKGKFDHGYIPSVIFGTTFGYSSSDMYTIYFSEPTTNVKEDKTKIPFMIVKGGNYPGTVESELIYLTSYYSHWNGKIIDLRTGQAAVDYDIYDLGDFDKNPNPYIERNYSVDTTNYQALSAFNRWVNRTFANGCGSDSNVPLLLKVEGLDPVTFAGTTLYKSFNVKFKASYCNGLNWEYNMAATTQDSAWSYQFGRTNSVHYIVNNQNYTRVRNYYNVYDESTPAASALKAAVLVKTYTGDASSTPDAEEPSAEVEGYMYLGSDTKTDTERTWDYCDSVYRYFAKLIDINLDYNIKYKAEYKDGSPAAGITLKGEATGADGYIQAADTYSLNLRNLYYKSAEGKYYFKTSGDYTRDSVAGSNKISCGNKDYYFNLDWNYLGDDIEASKLNSFDGLLDIHTYASGIKVIDGSDAFTKVVVITLDNPPAEHISIKKAKLELSKTSYTYNGKEKKPGVSVILDGKKLVKNKDYTVSYKNNKNIGTATVTITGKGNYTGTVSQKFKIQLAKGKTFTSGKYKYKVTGTSTVAFDGIKSTDTIKVVVPDTVKYGGKTFKVTSVSEGALKNKTKVKSVTIGTNVTKINKRAFYGCKNLKTITIKTTKLKTAEKEIFKGINSKATIKVPKSKLSAYKKLLKGKGQESKVKIVKY